MQVAVKEVVLEHLPEDAANQAARHELGIDVVLVEPHAGARRIVTHRAQQIRHHRAGHVLHHEHAVGGMTTVDLGDVDVAVAAEAATHPLHR